MLIVALVTAFAAILGGVAGPSLFPDSRDYMAAARGILAGEYPRYCSLPFFRPPLYPLMIAGLLRLWPESRFAILAAQAGLFAGTCLLLHRIAEHSLRHPRIGLSAGLLYAANPLALRQVADVQSETLHAFLVVLGVSLVAPLHDGSGRPTRDYCLAGMVFGLAALCRPTALPVSLALFAALLALEARRRRPGLVARPALATAAGLCLAILPWTLANFAATGEFILITDAAGYHLWLGNHPANLKLQLARFESARDFNALSYSYLQRELPAALMSRWESEGGYARLPLLARERLWRREAAVNALAAPLQTLELLALKAWAYWRPWLHPAAYSPAAVLASGAYMLALYAAALIGARKLVGAGFGAFVLSLAALFVASMGVHVLTHVMVRFRLPYVDPFLAILAAAALWPVRLREQTLHA